MPKKPSGRAVITPLKPKEAIRRLKKNGFLPDGCRGGDCNYKRVKNGKLQVVGISMHPEDLRKPYIDMILRKSGKSKEEWVNL